MKLDPYLIPLTKINSKQITELNIRAKTISLLEGNIEVNLFDLRFGNGFLDMTPEAYTTKEKICKLDFIKILKFCASKDTMKKVKRHLTE